MKLTDSPPGNAGPKDLDPEEFREAGHALIDWIADYYARLEGYPVAPTEVEAGQLLDKLPADPPAHGSAQSAILDDFENVILPHAVHWSHPGFMAYFAAGGSSAGVLGDALSSALNNVGLLWRASPALAEVEERTMGWLAKMLRLPESWFGMIHGTASTASLHAVIAAREMAAQRARDAGSQLDLNRIVLYTSEQAHSSIEKAMAVLGRGPDACRKVGCDELYAMRPDMLRRAIAADRDRGLEPIAVVATVGTTASTAVDPVPVIAEIAAEHSLWLHVDAAYAGTAAMLPEMQHHFTGCELADSYVVNPHKWLFVPLDLSAFYMADPEHLRRALAIVPEYLRSFEHPRAVNYMEYTVSLGRRFRALKLWYVLRSFGTERIAALLREHIRLARLLASWVDEAPDFERLAPTEFALVCLRYRPEGASDAEADEASERLLHAVNKTGLFFLSHARLGGHYAIRVSIGIIRTTEVQVRELWALFQELKE